MNLRCIVISAMLFTNLFYSQTQAITEVTSDAQFQRISRASREAVIAVGNKGNPSLLPLIEALIQEEVSGNFPTVHFCYAFTENIPNAVKEYQVNEPEILAFVFGSSLKNNTQFNANPVNQTRWNM